jgi:glycosyltransferase involved in cell wall biosynthesis
LKILQIHNRYREAGGEDAVVTSEAALLGQAGHEVVPYVVENPPGSGAALRRLAVAAWNPASSRRIHRLAEITRPDVAHVHNTWFSLSPAILRTLHRGSTPVTMTLHNYRLLCANASLVRSGKPCQLCVGSHPWHGVRHRCYRGSAAASLAAAGTIALNRTAGTWVNHVDLFLTLTAFARDLFIRGGLPEDRLLVKANSVTDPGPRPEPPSASSTILYVGRLSEIKGLPQLLDAWKDAASSGLELVVVGDGPLRHLVADGGAARIRATGPLPRDQVRELMLSARALVFPSVWYEGQPMAILEALAAGLPVMASDLGGIAETLEGMPPAWLIPAGSRPAWEAGLAQLADDGAVDEGGRRGRELYQRAFTPEHSLEALEAAYRQARKTHSSH